MTYQLIDSAGNLVAVPRSAITIQPADCLYRTAKGTLPVEACDYYFQPDAVVADVNYRVQQGERHFYVYRRVPGFPWHLVTVRSDPNSMVH